MTLQEKIARLRELEKKATPGPWDTYCGLDVNSNGPDQSYGRASKSYECLSYTNGFGDAHPSAIADAELIAEMRNNLPTLLDELERLQDENKSLEFNLKQKSGEIGRAEHRGNTVDYIYDKCRLYGEQLAQAQVELVAAKAALDKILGGK